MDRWLHGRWSGSNATNYRSGVLSFCTGVMEIYLIRHTTPDVAKGICYGQTDLALTATFPEEAEHVLKQLPPDLDVVYSSPLHLFNSCFPSTLFSTSSYNHMISFSIPFI